MQALKSLEESEQWDMVSNEGFKLRYQHLHGTPAFRAARPALAASSIQQVQRDAVHQTAQAPA